MPPTAGKLYLVPTPIGNMSDITDRAIDTLKSVQIIACEDTRTSGNLLNMLGISNRLISYHDFNETERSAQLAKQIENGESIAIITDAGSPGISDPAYRLVRRAIDVGIEIIALPGPTAIIPALTASGLPTDRFFFEGFLPPKSGSRKNRLERLKDFEHTLVFYESPHRIYSMLVDAREVLGDRQACLAREISKIHEEYRRGTLSAIIESLENQDRTIKGEIVVIVEGYEVVRVKKNKYKPDNDSENDSDSENDDKE
ncbi:MAG: 16S rRNA (cytidine(1402)-2'-O)-methyltransferase [candidate division Zixibacteria bacterium]|nr:16S rRNA (cytidine(1402)-2'-O)-methyltransferase [candidate division Zixibacteria bacterium]